MKLKVLPCYLLTITRCSCCFVIRTLLEQCCYQIAIPSDTPNVTHDAIITSLLRQNNVVTSFWRNNCVVCPLGIPICCIYAIQHTNQRAARKTYYVLSFRCVFVMDLIRTGPGQSPRIGLVDCSYRQVSNIRRTKSQHLKDSRTVLWLSLPNPLKPDVKSRMMLLEQCRQAMLQLHLSDRQSYCLLGCVLYYRFYSIYFLCSLQSFKCGAHAEVIEIYFKVQLTLCHNHLGRD